jgi:hypothetical protein
MTEAAGLSRLAAGAWIGTRIARRNVSDGAPRRPLSAWPGWKK